MQRTSTKFPWVGLVTLSALIFLTVTSEFLPTGLLPEIARDLDVSQAQVGILITVFAGAVVVTAAPLATITRRFPRKPLIMVVLLVFVVANVCAAIAPSYLFLLLARVLGGLAHGLFWAVVGAYSGHLVPKKMLGRAVAITSGGGTAAFVLGVPVGTAIGHAVGWRAAFVVIAVAMVVLMVVALKLLPPVQHIEPLVTGEIPLPLRRDKTIPDVILICVTVIVAMTAHNLFYTFITPFLLGPVGVPVETIALILFLYGSAGVLGLVLAGLFANRYPRASLSLFLLTVVVSVGAIGLFSGNPWVVLPAIALWSVGLGATPTALHARMLHAASRRIRDVASAYLTTSFNIGIGLGALVGALLLEQFSVGVLPFVDVALTVLALVVFLVGDARLRRRAVLR